MPNPKYHEGFVVLNEGKIPHEVIHEIKHYNGLVKTLEQSKVQEVQQLAIINSEVKLLKFFEQYPDLYPNHIVYGYIPLIEYLTKNKVKAKNDLFQTLCNIQDANTFIFIAQELFHNLHQNKLSYTEHDLKKVLEKTRSISQVEGGLKEPINLFLNELEHYKQNSINYDFFSKSKQKAEINTLFAEIRSMIITPTSRR